jgi:hypothetical protein
MNILDAFNDIGKLEVALSSLYLYFSKLFSGDAAAASIFEKLGNEEKVHYNLVQYQRNIVRQNQKLFREVEVDVQEIRAIINRVESITKRVPPPLLNESIQIATDFESSASETHYRTVMEQANQKVSFVNRQAFTWLSARSNNLLPGYFLYKYARPFAF